MIRQKAQTYQMMTGAKNDLHAIQKNNYNELADKKEQSVVLARW